MNTFGIVTLAALLAAGPALAQVSTPAVPDPTPVVPASPPAAVSTPPYAPLSAAPAPNAHFKLKHVRARGAWRNRGGTPITAADPDIRVDAVGQVISSPDP